MIEATRRFVDPQALARVRNLEFEARTIVEGYLAGMHRSPYHGFAVEFAQHREYVPGDDVKHIDWKVYARSERHYLKQYEQDTNLIGWLLVDASESMKYGSRELSKYDYSCRAAAALAYLILQQADSVGLVTFDAQVRDFMKPSGQPSQFNELLHRLVGGPGSSQTRLGPILHELSGRLARRGVVLMFSDLLDDPDAILAGLKHLRYQRHDVVVFHVVDPAEADFPFQDPTLFRGMEQLPELLTDPRGLRDGYLEEFERHTKQLSRGCRGQNVEFVPLNTGDSPGVALSAWLSRRAKR